ncbi:disintegrin and metalloproteinase domain-containing protein 12 [Bactrocera dorsalis]|uniref:Disintegrin and metalloproteinase domain-containing protein 12 n=1 Tax=Bactrocera dorsalis TaxID=27457 RepID=A0A6I9V2L7_BACDO|nr:disintegrin and metalloproteinase domain-containing protein 12 [Bactrocera dorsalis]
MSRQFLSRHHLTALGKLLLLVTICWQAACANASENAQTKAHSSYPQTGDFFPALNEFTSHSVIRPEIQHGRHKRALRSTLDAEEGQHVPHITLTYQHEGQRVHIDLHRNDELLPAEHFLRYQHSNSPTGRVVKNFTKTELELCHYQGTIRGKPLSNVAISTCNGGGVNGLVYDGTDTYFIHSGSDGRLQDDHFLFRHADLLNKNATCGYDSATDNHAHTPFGKAENLLRKSGDLSEAPMHLDGSEINRILRYKRSYENNDVIRGPYNANKHSSYVELVIVVDNKLYKSFGESSKKVHQHCKDLANIINALYVPLNIFVALVGVVIWNEYNEIEFSTDGDLTLRNFLNYRRTKLVLDHPNDNAQLLTKEQFSGGVVGKALKGPICTHEYSGGVSNEHSQIVAVVATTMAHEMGHNFGMEHDSSDCKCQDEKCIMSASSTSVVPVHWSSCSIDQLNIAFSRGMNYCLRNKPTKLFESPQCGNGFVEPGEQCDCGLPNYCENTCCDPYTCMLHTNASCATGECCDLSTCRPKAAGQACRVAENECDLPEYCTGESEYCPADVFKRDTEECDSGQAYCFQGNCRSHSQQCRILWGPTGESSEHCYSKNVEGKRGGNCGFDRINNTFIRCEDEHVRCGMLHCRHLNERLEFGMESAAVLSHSFINHEGNIVPCRTALVDLGLQSTDPGLTPNGAKCGEDKMCVNQKCLTIERVRATGLGRQCPDNCNGNGVCNSLGNCHCHVGYSGTTCRLPGPGGSINSGPASSPTSHQAFQNFMYIFFFGVIPFMVFIIWLSYYIRNRRFFIGGKLAENIIKAASAKQAPARPDHGPHGGGVGGNGGHSLPKSTPSSTDDMNSALLKSPSDSNDTSVGNGMFGKFKGFTLRPLNDTTSPTNNFNAPNVAYVQPTVQDTAAMNGGVPQRSAPPPPLVKGKSVDAVQPTRWAPPPPVGVATAPALPPPNPGSNARPIISMPVLETSTMTLPLKKSSGEVSPTPSAPLPASQSGSLPRPAPPPPVPLHADPKLNVKRDGTIRRIASFLKKEEKAPLKEKTYIDREKLKNIEISAPMPVAPQGESSNSDSETTPKEEETKNLVKRAQSMRSPTKKTNVQTFGSMRYAPGSARPKSVAAAAAASRPKSPPPRPPPLKKTNSTTSSGYALPVATAKSNVENTYDDCEFVEQPLTTVGESSEADSPTSTDNIYSVIDEIPPAAQTVKRSDFINESTDMGLLGEIVNEIEKRNGDSIYSASTLVKNKPQSAEEVKNAAADVKTKPNATNNISTNHDANGSADAAKSSASANTVTAQTVPTYLRPAPVNAPVARVAPTRADLTSPTAFSSFKPTSLSAAPTAVSAASAVNKNSTTAANRLSGANSTSGNAATTRNRSFAKTPVAANSTTTTTRTTNSSNSTALPSATITKPKPLSAKPSFNSQKKVTPAPSVGATGARLAATGTPRTAPTVKSGNIASLTQRFEKGATTNARK